jgi:hypothetical protein
MSDDRGNLLFDQDGETRRWQGVDAEKERIRNWAGDLISTSTTERSIAENLAVPDFTPAVYDGVFGWALGPIDYQAPNPPKQISGLENHVTGPPARFYVIDGDTIDYEPPAGGVIRFRLMGIDAPEDPDLGGDALTAKEDLMEMVAGADTITIGQFNVDRYGTTQSFWTTDASGNIRENERVFAWLYIDGVPVYSLEAFSATNPRGVGIGDTVPPYRQMWIDNGGEPEGGVT